MKERQLMRGVPARSDFSSFWNRNRASTPGRHLQPHQLLLSSFLLLLRSRRRKKEERREKNAEGEGEGMKMKEGIWHQPIVFSFSMTSPSSSQHLLPLPCLHSFSLEKEETGKKRLWEERKTVDRGGRQLMTVGRVLQFSSSRRTDVRNQH